MSRNGKLTWADYPAPRVKKVKGKYSIVVSVPRAIRHLFGTPEVAKATGTIDRAIAEKKLILFGNELYAKLDQKQIDAEQATYDEVDLIAIEAITTFANAIRYKGGRIPQLVAETEYTELTRLKNRLDAFVEQHRDGMVEDAEKTAYIKELLEEGKNQGLLDSQTVEVENLSAEQTHALEALRKKIRDVRASDPPTMFDDQHSIVRDYGFKVVDSFWQDLLTQAAQQQGHPAPVFDTPTGGGYVKLKLADDDEPKVYPEGLARFLNHPEHVADRGYEVDFQTVERNRRVQSNDALRISDVRTEYVAHVETKYDKKNTQRKWIRAIDRFIELIGDVPLREIDGEHIGSSPVTVAGGVRFINNGALLDREKSIADFKYNAPNSMSRVLADAVKNPQLSIALRSVLPQLSEMGTLFAREALLTLPSRDNQEAYLQSIKGAQDKTLITASMRALRREYLGSGRNSDMRNHSEVIVAGIRSVVGERALGDPNRLEKQKLVRDMKVAAAHKKRGTT
ncbi:MAG TPA: hypothetical protein DE314_07330 [Sulfitobacter sp.]|nr:hypothetical protein [Sulfitobacter sp.]